MEGLDLGQDPGMGLFDFSASMIVASLVFTVVGFYFYRRGKKMTNYGVILMGIALMVYPLFISGKYSVWITGAALSGVAYYFDSRQQQL